MTQRVAGAVFSASHEARVGRYSYWPGEDRWWWSESMYQLHGFEPGDVVPTTELVMRHIHPEDVPAAWESFEGVLQGRPFSFLHRIRTAAGQQLLVLAAGHLEDDAGAPVIHGHLVDLTDIRDEAAQLEADASVSDFLDHRAIIEQAKGVLIQLYSVDADTAWGLLRAFSSDTNRKVRDIAQVLVESATADRTPVKSHAGSAHDVLTQLYQRLSGA